MAEERIDFPRCFRPVVYASGIPLYTQVVQQVEDALGRKAIVPGQFLPPEPELCDGFADRHVGRGREACRALLCAGRVRDEERIGAGSSAWPSAASPSACPCAEVWIVGSTR